MAHHQSPASGTAKAPVPYWSQALRALRLARGITQDGWAAQLGYGRATIRRWEAGETVPSADAEAAIIELCGEKGLFRTFTDSPLEGVTVTPEWIADLLAAARLGHDLPEPATTALELQQVPVRYALSGHVAIAYQVVGDGPIDLVVTPGAVSHRELDWEHPGARQFFGDLARFARVVVFDKRGTGMSDRVGPGTLQERMDDIRAVMDAVGMKRAALFGVSEGGPIAIEFAATWPERVAALVLYGTYDRFDEYPSPEDQLAQLERLRSTWGTPDSGFLERFGPSVAANPDVQAWWARYLRQSASPGAVVALNRMNEGIDVRPHLPALDMPTLVLHRSGDRAVDISHGFRLAESIPNVRFMALEGDDHLPWLGDVESITGAVDSFLSGTCSYAEADHVLAAVLATVPANEERGGSFLEDHRDIARREVFRWRGTVLPTERNGVLAMFDSPTRAIHCARAIRNATRSPGSRFRTGIHAGEVYLEAGRAEGAVVETGERLAYSAAPGEVLVSEIVAGLTAGADVAFIPRDVRCHTGDMGVSFRVFAVEE